MKNFFLLIVLLSVFFAESMNMHTFAKWTVWRETLQTSSLFDLHSPEKIEYPEDIFDAFVAAQLSSSVERLR